LTEAVELNALSRVLLFCAFAQCAIPVSLASPLFDDETRLELIIEAPMNAIVRNKHDREVHDAVVRYQDSSGQEIVLNARLSSRGNARLEACEFPPLRLTIKKGERAGTIFAGQKRLKMVTQCKDGNTGEKWLLQELGIYRAYNVISDYSYRTRRIDVTYRNSESKGRDRTQMAFFIESTGEMADRLQLDSIRPPTIQNFQYEPTEITNNVLFQLLIANTDFSIRLGPTGEGCCHNGRVLTRPSWQDNWIVVPYDFDQAGIINTDYALADRRLGIRRVTQRKYRGYCSYNESLPAALNVFRERREAITAALIPAEFSASRQKKIRRFTEGFYKILDDPKELQEEIMDDCRETSTFSIRKTSTP
jgi:hypothetical protein